MTKKSVVPEGLSELPAPGGGRRNAVSEPDWDLALKVPTRRIIEVVAMAGNVRPTPRAVAAQIARNPAWGKAFDKVLTAVTLALYPERKHLKIFYDPKTPHNKAKDGVRSEHKNLLVDVGTAVLFIASKYGIEGMSPGFRRLYDHHSALAAQSQVVLTNQSESQVVNPVPTRPPKSQKKAIHSKDVKAVAILFLAVVNRHFGWTNASEPEREGTLDAIEAALDELGPATRYGLRRTGYESWLEFAVKEKSRQPRMKNRPDRSPENS